MIRRTALAVLTLPLLLVLAPCVVAGHDAVLPCDADSGVALAAQQAASGITVIDSGVEIRFPEEARFTLEAQSATDIVDVRLRYSVDRMRHIEVVSEGWAGFEPADTVEASWVWDMRKASLPPGAGVTYWWLVEDAVGNKLETPPETMRFDDDRYQWQSITASGFLAGGEGSQGGEVTLYWYQGSESFARELLDECETGLARLTEDIGAYPDRPIQIYVYASPRDLQGAMVFPHEWTGGVAFTEFSTIAIGIAPAQRDWGKRALVHELTHLVVHQATFSPYGQLPTWLDEGLATYNEGALLPELRSRLERAADEDRLISVRSLCSPFSAESEKARLSYAQSYSLVAYLLDNYGQDRMLELLTVLKEGSTYDDALIGVYGFDIEGLDARWRATLSGLEPANSPPVWLSYGPALLFAALAMVVALVGVLAFRRRR